MGGFAFGSGKRSFNRKLDLEIQKSRSGTPGFDIEPDREAIFFLNKIRASIRVGSVLASNLDRLTVIIANKFPEV